MASIISGFEYDIFISYRQKDNKGERWVSEFVDALKNELGSTFKEEISVYFDINPHDGLLETHLVDASLEEKIKSLILIPIISQTYCDSKCFAWQKEFCAFNKFANEDRFGRDIKLSSGNIASRILPVKIHELDSGDTALLENELGRVLRSIDFIYKANGVNRPLKPNDNRTENLNHTYYPDQINKVANAVKEIIDALKGDNRKEKVSISHVAKKSIFKRSWVKSSLFILVMAALVSGYLLLPKIKEFLHKPKIEIGKSIAVLPFTNISNDPEQQYFSDGVTEAILNSLSHLKDFKVPARTSSFLFRNKDPREAGKKLGVKMVLEGSVQHNGDKIRISVRLIDTNSGFNIWSNQYTEKEDDIFAIQDEIANSIAEKLEVTFLGNTNQINTLRLPRSKEAHDLYLKGRFFWNQGTAPTFNKAITLFQQAIAVDPLYAEAYSGLADCYASLGYGSFLAPEDAIPKAKMAAAKALEIDSTLAEPHASIAFITFYYDWNWGVAEKEFKKALALNPNYELAYAWYGYYLTSMERYNEASVILKKAKDLDPLSAKITTDMGFSLYYSGKYDQANDELQASLDLNAKFGLTHVWRARVYQAKKMYDKAIAEYRETLKVIPNWPVALAGIGNIYGQEGRREEALQMLDTLNALSSKQYVTSYGIALIYVSLGDRRKTFEWLDKAYAERSNWLVWIKSDPRWEPIRSDKRYLELVKKVGF